MQYLKHVTKTVAVDPLTVEVETDGIDPILLNELQNVWIVSRKNGENATTADYNSGKAAIGTGTVSAGRMGAGRSHHAGTI